MHLCPNQRQTNDTHATPKEQLWEETNANVDRNDMQSRSGDAGVSMLCSVRHHQFISNSMGIFTVEILNALLCQVEPGQVTAKRFEIVNFLLSPHDQPTTWNKTSVDLKLTKFYLDSICTLGNAWNFETKNFKNKNEKQRIGIAILIWPSDLWSKSKARITIIRGKTTQLTIGKRHLLLKIEINYINL